jgi:hypothetical protein
MTFEFRVAPLRVLVSEGARLPVVATLQSKGSASIHEHSKKQSEADPFSVFGEFTAIKAGQLRFYVRHGFRAAIARSDKQSEADPFDSGKRCLTPFVRSTPWFRGGLAARGHVLMQDLTPCPFLMQDLTPCPFPVSRFPSFSRVNGKMSNIRAE